MELDTPFSGQGRLGRNVGKQELAFPFVPPLWRLLSHVTPEDDRLLQPGDFNARVGSDFKSWPDVVGPHGMGQENSNGQLLFTLCSELAPAPTPANTWFQLPDIHKATWMHPRSGRWHLIDYVITRRRDIQDVRITRAMRGADCWTDHLLLKTRLSFSITCRHRRQKADIKLKLDVRTLADPEIQNILLSSLADQLKLRMTA